MLDVATLDVEVYPEGSNLKATGLVAQVPDLGRLQLAIRTSPESRISATVAQVVWMPLLLMVGNLRVQMRLLLAVLRLVIRTDSHRRLLAAQRLL